MVVSPSEGTGKSNIGWSLGAWIHDVVVVASEEFLEKYCIDVY